MAFGDTQRYNGKAIWITVGGVSTNQMVTGSFTQLSRVTENGWIVNYPLTQDLYLDGAVNVNDTVPASVDTTLTWYNTNARNERAIGLADLGVSGVMGLNLEEEKNLYVAIENARGSDAIGTLSSPPDQTIIALGHTLLTSYDLRAGVGGFVESTATFNSLTAYVYSGSTGNAVPTVNYQNGTQSTNQFYLPPASAQFLLTSDDPAVDVAAIGSRDMILAFPSNSPFGIVFTGTNSCYLQSFNLTLTIDRRQVKPLGYVYPPNRSTFYPIRVDLTTEAIVNRYQADQLDRLRCGGNHSINVMVKQPCSNFTMFGFQLTEMQLENQTFSTSIGPMDTVSIKWRGLINSPLTPLFDPTYNFLVGPDGVTPFGTTW